MGKYRILVKGIVKYQDNYLVVEKWFDDRISDPFQWDFINGELEFGEEPDKGILRVVSEQTGLNVEMGHPLYTWTFMVGEVCNIGISYLCHTGMQDIILSEELNDYRWITSEEFDEYIANNDVLKDIHKIGL